MINPTSDYLLIETGGFNTKGGSAWKSPWMIMKRL